MLTTGREDTAKDKSDIRLEQRAPKVKTDK
jgi:hypothetical protein